MKNLLRKGQTFCNDFILCSFPYLFYANDPIVTSNTIDILESYHWNPLNEIPISNSIIIVKLLGQKEI